MSDFLATIPERLWSTIHTFCSDMWEGYLSAIGEFISEHPALEAHLVADRFHIAKQYRDCVDTVRKQVSKQLRKTLPEDEYKTLTERIHWVVRRNHAAVDEDDRQRLRDLFQHAPQLHQAYTLREELTAIFNLPLSVATGRQRLLAWARKAERLAPTCFTKFIKLLRRHIDLIANYFLRRASSGFVEGFNNKLKLITRRSYGIRRTDSLFRRLWLDTAGYRLFIA